MMYLIAYILIALVVAQRIFAILIRNEVRDWGKVNNDEIFFAAIFSILLCVVWPVMVTGYAIYTFILVPTIESIKKEEGK